jgi:UDP-2,4-diacetamido-2,4,6-trideoxy-beta-L-altropyranose hydrolase
MIRVGFRADASKKIGAGHLMRCQAFAQTLILHDVDSIFFTRGSSLPLIRQRFDWLGQVVLIPDNLSLEQEVGWIAEQQQVLQLSAIVLDGYHFNTAYRHLLRACIRPLIIYDDLNDSGSLNADMVINCSDVAKELGYETTAAEAVQCLGSDYRLLRKEFNQLTNVPFSQRNVLTLVMGGSDPFNLTLPILRELEQRPTWQLHLCVITGSLYPHLAELSVFLQQSKLNIQHKHNCQNMASMFSSSRLVVSAAGSSQYEILACQAPALLLVVADNQLPASLFAEQQGWCQIQDLTDFIDIASVVDKFLGLWSAAESLEFLHLKACQFESNNGTALYSQLSRLIAKFTDGQHDR